MPRAKGESTSFKIGLRSEVYKTLQEESEINGVSMSAYISMLIMKNSVERKAMKFVGNFTSEQLQEAMKNQP